MHRRRPTRHILLAVCTAIAIVAGVSVEAFGECAGFEAESAAQHKLEYEELDEASGMAASARYSGKLWHHNDSGDAARLFLSDETGAHIGTVRLDGVDAVDFEDMAVAPCEKDRDASCLYIADIGDNLGFRPQVAIYKVPEPEIPDERPFELNIHDVESLTFRYADGPRNAETLLVHPETLTLHVVDKGAGDAAGIWRVPHASSSKKRVTAKRVQSVEFTGATRKGRQPTAGDIAPDGSRLTIRTYGKLFTWCLTEDESVADALERSPTVTNPPKLAQPEALAYDRTSDAIWLSSEGRPAALITLTRDE